MTDQNKFPLHQGKNIYLSGFMASGKSTVGRLLSLKLQRLFVDTDDYIERLEHRSVKEIFEDTLKYPDSEILTWMPYPYLNLGEEFFWEYYNPKRVEKKIWMRVLAPDTQVNREAGQKMQKFIVVTQFVSNNVFSEFDIEIKIYGKTKIGIISYGEDLGIIIESQKIHNGFRAIFESMCLGAKNSNKGGVLEDE